MHSAQRTPSGEPWFPAQYTSMNFLSISLSFSRSMVCSLPALSCSISFTTLPLHYDLSVAGGTDITLDAYLVDTHGEIGHGQVACFDHGSGQTAAAGNLHPEHRNTLRRGNA